MTYESNFKLIVLLVQRIRAAIKEDDSETVQEILCNGLDPNRTFSIIKSGTNRTFLHEAARYDAVKSARVSHSAYRTLVSNRNFICSIPQILLDFGASVDKRSTLKYTPLHYAAWFGSLKVAEVRTCLPELRITEAVGLG